MDSNITIGDLDKICRVCLTEDENLQPFHELNEEIVDIFRDATQLQLDENDDYPKNLCPKCMRRLKILCIFVLDCRDNDVKLKCSFVNFDHNYLEQNSKSVAGANPEDEIYICDSDSENEESAIDTNPNNIDYLTGVSDIYSDSKITENTEISICDNIFEIIDISNSLNLTKEIIEPDDSSFNYLAESGIYETNLKIEESNINNLTELLVNDDENDNIMVKIELLATNEPTFNSNEVIEILDDENTDITESGSEENQINVTGTESVGLSDKTSDSDKQLQQLSDRGKERNVTNQLSDILTDFEMNDEQSLSDSGIDKQHNAKKYNKTDLIPHDSDSSEKIKNSESGSNIETGKICDESDINKEQNTKNRNRIVAPPCDTTENIKTNESGSNTRRNRCSQRLMNKYLSLSDTNKKDKSLRKRNKSQKDQRLNDSGSTSNKQATKTNSGRIEIKKNKRKSQTDSANDLLPSESGTTALNTINKESGTTALNTINKESGSTTKDAERSGSAGNDTLEQKRKEEQSLKRRIDLHYVDPKKAKMMTTINEFDNFENDINNQKSSVLVRFGKQVKTCCIDDLKTLNVVGFECFYCAKMFNSDDKCTEHLIAEH